MSSFLQDIVAYKQKLVAQNKHHYSSIKEQLCSVEHSRYSIFKKRISQTGQMNLIAEIKKASPSKGLIRQDFNLLDIAKVYAEHGAAAISILTEDKYFLGNPDYVKHVREVVDVPLLTKDFIIDEGQIYEAMRNGASAALLIVAILGNDQIKQFLSVAEKLDVDCLVEAHDEIELDRALECGAEIIGINNRNLHTFEVDMRTCEKLIPKIPKDKVIVAESGIKTHDDIKKLQEFGANAVLIGETFMREENIGQKIEELMHDKS